MTHTQIAEMLREELREEHEPISLYSGIDISEISFNASEISQEELEKIAICGSMSLSKSCGDEQPEIVVTIE